jgi:hypothetical protein
MEENKTTDDSGYDPAHIGAMIVLVFFALTVLFWLLWTLLVFKGGILTKCWGLLQIVSGRGPVEAELWDGWVINIAALMLSGSAIYGIKWIFKRKGK